MAVNLASILPRFILYSKFDSKGGPTSLFSNTFDTKYSAENFTDTDSDTDINAYRHMIAIIIHLLLYKYIYKAFQCLSVLIRYGFLATT